MATLFDWIKLILENKWLVILAFSTISSLSGNLYGYFQLEEKKTEIKATRNQVTAVAELYSQSQSVSRETVPTTTIIQKTPRDVIERLEWIERQLGK